MCPDALPRPAVLRLLDGVLKEARHQRLGLARLRESIAALAEVATAPDVPWRTLQLLFEHLGRVAGSLGMTLAGARALVAHPAHHE